MLHGLKNNQPMFIEKLFFTIMSSNSNFVFGQKVEESLSVSDSLQILSGGFHQIRHTFEPTAKHLFIWEEKVSLPPITRM